MQDQNSQPTTTLPPKEIYSHEQVKQVISQSQIQPFDKQKIIANSVGPKKIPPKFILILLGVLFFILIITVLAKSLVSRSNQNKQVTLTWWSLEEDEAAVRPLIDEYKQKNPNVSVNFVKQSSQDYRERLTNSFIKGQGPDIFEFHNTWLPMLIGYMSFNSADLASSFYPVFTSDVKTKSGFAGIPLEYDGIALFVNQDIFRAYGKDYPKTWDDLRKIAADLTVRDQTGGIRQSGVAMGVTDNVDYWEDVIGVLALQNGVDVTNFNTLTGQSVLTFYTDFSKHDLVWDNTLPNSSAYFNTGKLAMYFGKYADAISFSKNQNLHFQVVPIPQLPATANNSAISYANYWINGVSKNSVDVSAAWQFLNFMSSKESLLKLHKNEVDVRGYGNLYPRPDMQNELLSDSIAGPFVYQASFAKDWYLAGKTNDGPTGINSQIAKPFGDSIAGINMNTSVDVAAKNLQPELIKILASYGLVAAPLPTK